LNEQPYDLIVIGSGPAGLTAALYGHRSGLSVWALGGETPGGQVVTHQRIDNYPGFPGGVAGAQLAVHWIRQFVDETGSMPCNESATQVDFSGPIKSVSTPDGVYRACAVIVATGASPRLLGVPGETELAGKGVYYCATCDGPLLRRAQRRRAAVAGGGDAAVHTALALLPHAESVSLICRSRELRARAYLVNRLKSTEGVRLVLGRAIKAIEGTDKVAGVVVEHVESGQVDTLAFDAVFVGVGQAPVTGFLNGALALNDQGFIVTDSLLQTSVPGIFAAGDVRDSPLRQIVTAAADGALAAHSAAEFLRENA
jgi:thioredoxin reductase (NADPH)